MTDIRIGHGYDVHALQEGLPLIIAGVRIEHTKGCVAHSDGDVVAHALCDALLGAVAEGDIGKHFPDSSEQYRDADSMELLKRVVEIVAERGYGAINVDITILIQSPKIAPYIEQMRYSLAEALDIEVGQMSVKATTEEGLGFTGEERGVAAHAVVLVGRL